MIDITVESYRSPVAELSVIVQGYRDASEVLDGVTETPLVRIARSLRLDGQLVASRSVAFSGAFGEEIYGVVASRRCSQANKDHSAGYNVRADREKTPPQGSNG